MDHNFVYQRVFVESLSRRWLMEVWLTFRGELDPMTRSLRWMESHSQDIVIRSAVKMKTQCIKLRYEGLL